jgi:hypothetical protein
MNVRADAGYSSDYYYNLRNFSADKYDSYVIVNLGVGWASEDDAWYVSSTRRTSPTRRRDARLRPRVALRLQ